MAEAVESQAEARWVVEAEARRVVEAKAQRVVEVVKEAATTREVVEGAREMGANYQPALRVLRGAPPAQWPPSP